MKELKRILIASHNTPGARAAEELAFSLASKVTRFDHLIVVPEFWQWMTGDDWLNNAHTQKEYGDYVEAELEREIIEHVDRLKKVAAERDIKYRPIVEKGKPDMILLQCSQRGDYDLVIIGTSRPKGVDGLNSKMLTPKLFPALKVPLMISPYPDE